MFHYLLPFPLHFLPVLNPLDDMGSHSRPWVLLNCSSGPKPLQPCFWLWSVTSCLIPGGTGSKEPACQCRSPERCRFDPWIGKIHWRRAWQPSSVILPGEVHGQRSLAAPLGSHRVRHEWSDLAHTQPSSSTFRPSFPHLLIYSLLPKFPILPKIPFEADWYSP